MDSVTPLRARTRWSEAARYTVLGGAFGLCFPAVAVLFLYVTGQMPSAHGLLEAVRDAHRNLLLYVVDTAPVFLGLFARLAGSRQDRLAAFSAGLEQQVAEKTDSLRQALDRAERANEMVLHLAEHDGLTGLLNRRAFQKELERWVQHALRYERPVSLLFLDADRFKSVNDTHGHQVGDEYLITVSTTLKTLLRDTDVIARLGGDEFAALLPEATEDTAHALAATLIQHLADHPVGGVERGIYPSLSIGVATLPQHAQTAQDLVFCSDAAMYEAKGAGGRCARVYRLGCQTGAREHARWDGRIQQALEHDQFVLFYQPLLNLATATTDGYEALLRMEDPNGALIGPGLFLESAERFSLSWPIDRMVIRKAAGKVASLGAEDPWISLNLSQQSLLDPHLLEYLKEIFKDAAFAPERLQFEVTEAIALQHAAAVRALGSRLKEWGTQLIIDDFSVGTSSLRSLEGMPVSLAKIEGGLVRDLANRPANQKLIKGLAHIAHDQGLRVVAKFIEDVHTLHLVQTLGVDYVQGFAVGQPMESLEVAHALSGSPANDPQGAREPTWGPPLPE